MIEENTFNLLNVEGNIDNIGWQDNKKSKLWRYNQHYFDDLNASNSESRNAWHQNLISEWIEKNPPVKGHGWEPYPTSLRIVNWIKWALRGNQLGNEAVYCLAIQARWLEKRIEWHLLGNHLFSNAKALVYSGLFFDGIEPKKWLNKCKFNVNIADCVRIISKLNKPMVA